MHTGRSQSIKLAGGSNFGAKVRPFDQLPLLIKRAPHH